MFNRTGFLALAVALVVGIAVGMLLPGVRQRNAPPPMLIHTAVPTTIIEPTATAAPTVTPAAIQVYINGAVAFPDVYELPPNCRVKQAVEAAGGFSAAANTAVVNLALPLVDGMHIYIPALTESTAVPQTVITAPGSRAIETIEDGAGGGHININTAGLEELDRLPGIGPAIAQRIIDYRAANGSFPAIDAVLEVSGIGEAKFAQIRDLITVGE